MAVSAEHIQQEDNPFRDQVDRTNYFEDEDRADLEQKIAYFLEFGSDILFIHCELESGKSVLVQRTIEDKAQEWVSCYVSAEKGNDIGSLLGVLADSFNIDKGEPEAILSDLADRLTEIHSKGKLAVLFIDNADKLNPPIFKLIASITGIKISGQPVLRVALIGRSIPKELYTQIETTTNSEEITRVEVPVFTEEQTHTYIHHRLASTGSQQQALFNPATTQKIHKQAKGQPSHINALAHARLSQGMNQQTKTETNFNKKPASTDNNHFVLKLIAFALAVSVVISLFFFSSETDELKTSKETQLALPDLAPAEDAIIPPKEIPEPARPLQQKQTSTVDKTTDIAASIESTPPIADTKTTPRTTEVEPTKAAKETQKEAPQAALQELTPSRLELSHQWIKQQTPKNHTMQLIAVGSIEAAIKYLKNNGIEKDSAFFKTQRGGKTYFAVIHGSYSSKSAANAATKTLPPGLQKTKVWIRSFSGIQKTLQ